MKKVILLIAQFFLFCFCSSAQTLLTESFEGSFPPQGWTNINAGSGNSWTQSVSAANAYQGTKSVQYAFNSNTNANAWLFTKPLSFNGNLIQVSVYVKCSSSFYNEALKITVGNNNTVAAQTTTLLDSGGISNVTFRKWTATYLPPSAGTYYIGFNCYSQANQDYLYIDSVTVEQVNSSCVGNPTGGQIVANFSSICPNIPFSLSVQNATSGISGLSYQWYSSTDNINWTKLVNDTLIALQVNNGITKNTYYKRDIICGSLISSSSSYLVQLNPSSLCACNPYSSNNLHQNSLANIGFDSIQIASTNFVFKQTNKPSNGYTNLYDTTKSPTLLQAFSYTLSCKLLASGVSSAWIDWNRNGKFESTEYYPITQNALNGSIILTVPDNASIGKTLMRLRMNAAGTSISANDTCSLFAYGETVDVILQIRAGTPCNSAGLIAGTTVSSDTAICGNETFNLSVVNSSKNQIGLTYQWQSSNDGISFNPINGAQQLVLNNINITTNTYYRLALSCGTATSYSAVALVQVKPISNCTCSPLSGTSLHTSNIGPNIDTVNIVNTLLLKKTTVFPTTGYTLSTDTLIMPSLKQGQTYTLVTSFFGNANAGCWFDWNQNGNFDTSEFVSITTLGQRASINFTVPIRAALGRTILRVRTKNAFNGNILNSANACTLYTTGCTLDFLVQVDSGSFCAPANLVGGTVVSSSTFICTNSVFTLSVNNGTSNVLGLSYQWQQSTNGNTWSDIPGEINETFTATNGVQTATYFRRKITCGTSSVFSNSLYITVNAPQLCPCSPNNGTTLHTNTTGPNIVTTAISGTKLSYTHSGSSANGYSIFSDTVYVPTLQQGLTYSLVNSYSNQAVGGVWFDWNQNGNFDSSEFSLLVNNTTTSVLSFTVPINASLGKVLMRIRIRNPFGGGGTGALTGNDACSNFVNGATNDYIIQVGAGNICTGTVSAGTITSSTNFLCVGGSFTLSVLNSTTNVLGLKYQWQQSTDSLNWQDIAGEVSETYISGGFSSNTYFRRKITCQATNQIAYTSAFYVQVNPTQLCPCSPNNGTTLHTNTNGPFINNVNIIGTSLNYTLQGSVPTNSYILSTDSLLIPKLQQGVTYTLNTIYSGNAISSVWIDWNQDAQFDSTEWQQITTNATNGNISFTVPTTALTGKTILRIRTRGGAANGSTNACTTFGGGETIDFIVNVTNGVACSNSIVGGSTSITTVNYCSSTPISAVVNNASTGLLGLSYQWQQSVDNINWQDIAGQNQLALNAFVTATNVYVRRKMSCGSFDVFSTSVLTSLAASNFCPCSPNTGTVLHNAPAQGPFIDTVKILNSNFYYNSSTPTTSGYRIRTDSLKIPNLQQSNTYTLIANFNANAISAVWFDWNQDGTFDSTEYYLLTNATRVGTRTFVVPATAKLGKTLMRIRSRLGPALYTGNMSCSNINSGNTEDYVLNVVQGLACSNITLNAGNTVASKTSVCSNEAFALSVNNASAANGITYTWQQSTDSLTWSNLPADTLAFIASKTTTSDLYFRRGISCLSNTLYSTPVFVSVNPAKFCPCSPNTGTTLHTANQNMVVDSVKIVGTNFYYGPSATSTNFYTLFTDTAKMPSLKQSMSYTLSTYFSATGISSVWFDWNQNGVFDSTEWYQLSTTANNAAIVFTVPSNATLGTCLMRIRLRTGAQNGATNACTQFGSGETRDYIVQVTQGSSCSPSALVGGTVVSSSASICANSPITFNVSNGTVGLNGLTYQWQTSTDAINWNNIPNQTAVNATISNISSATYVRRLVSCGSSTANSSVVLVNINPTHLCPCSPLNGTTLNNNVQGASLDSVKIIGTALQYQTTSPVTNNYALYSDSQKVGKLTQGLTYSLQTNFGTNVIAAVWFDWNQNGLFDSAEYVQITTNSNSGIIPFTVPGNAVLGNTLMRIRTRLTGVTVAYNSSCSTFGSGETKDFLINIVQGSLCNSNTKAGNVVPTYSIVCATTNLNLTVSNATTGVSGLTYQWQSSSDNINWNNINNSNNPTYTVSSVSGLTYLRRVTICGTNSYNSTAAIVRVGGTNLCVCSPYTGTTLHTQLNGSYIDSVKLLGTILNSVSGTRPNNLYTLQSDSAKIPSVTQGISYTLQAYYSASSISSVWVDWNQNGVFDASEWQQLSTTGNTGKVQITVPANASIGYTIMRIRTRGGNANGATNACTSFASGETQDFTLKVLQGTTCNGLPSGGQAKLSASVVCINTPIDASVINGTSGLIGLSYQWQQSSDSINWVNLVNQTNATATFNALSAGYYRRIIYCGTDSAISTGAKLTLNANYLCACSPFNGTTLHNNINTPNIDSISILGTSLLYKSNFSVTASNGFSLTPTTVNLQQGVTYTFNVNTNANAISSVWFDWNQNGTFETSEWYQVATNATIATVQFTVPATATIGNILMRVRVRGTGAANGAANACTAFASGETEDYIVNVIAGNVCSTNLKAGYTIADALSICANSSFTLRVDSASTGTIGLSYQWQQSLDSISWTNLTNQSNQTLTVGGISVATYYRRSISCNTATVYALPVKISINPTYLCPCSPSTGTTLHNNTAPFIDSIFLQGTTLKHIQVGANSSSGYSLIDAIGVPPSLYQNYTYNLSFGFSAAAIGSVWFDWNQNGSFEASEWYQLTTNAVNGSINITVPANAALGKILMRVRLRGTGAANAAANACTQFGSGETKDFVVQVLYSPAVQKVAGTIKNNIGQIINGVKLYLNGQPANATPQNGSYLLYCNTGNNYVLRADKTNDVLKTNGVSTIDVALTLSHILQKNILNSPYKIIAADVNRDSKVNTIDIAFMRRLILGVDSLFPGKRLWTFVDSSFSFTNPTNPFPYKDSFQYTAINADLSGQNFIGIKLGDVNNDWNANLPKGTSLPKLILNYSIQQQVGNRIIVPITASQFASLFGLQFAIDYPKSWKLVHINTKLTDLDIVHHPELHAIACLWNDAQGKSRNLGLHDTLFSLEFDGILSNENPFSFNNTLTPQEVWNADLQKGNVILHHESTIVKQPEFSLLVSPNPTKNWIKVTLQSVQEGSDEIMIYDINGKQIFTEKIWVKAGENNLNIAFAGKIKSAGTYWIKCAKQPLSKPIVFMP